MLLISGSGTICHGCIGDRTARAGGWGFLIDNSRGSGFDIGRSILQYLAHALDGIGRERATLDPDEIELESLVKAHYAPLLETEPADLADIRPYLYEQPLEPRRVAALTPKIFEVAAAGNSVARSALMDAAVWLAQLVSAVLRRLSPSERVNLGLWGGLFSNAHSEELVIRPLLSSLQSDGAAPALDIAHLYRADGLNDVLLRAARHCLGGTIRGHSPNLR